MSIREAVKRIFGKKATEQEKKAMRELERNIVNETMNMLNPVTCRPASYTNLKAPMTFEELQILVPVQIRKPDSKKHKAVYGLLQQISKHLEESRRVSKQSFDFLGTFKEAPVPMKIRAIQEQMGACRFRLEVHDCKNAAEEACLKHKLFSLYETAKEVDPEGCARYEKFVNKQLRKRGRA